MTKKTYLCIGENFDCGCLMGMCGKKKDILSWLMTLTGRSSDFLTEYFDGYKDTEIVSYIYENYGKRLTLLR